MRAQLMTNKLQVKGKRERAREFRKEDFDLVQPGIPPSYTFSILEALLSFYAMNATLFLTSPVMYVHLKLTSEKNLSSCHYGTGGHVVSKVVLTARRAP